MAPPASDVVGQLPGGHLAAEVGVFGDPGVGTSATSEDDGGGVDLGEEESVEEGREAGGLETNMREMDKEEMTEGKRHRFLFVSMTWTEQWYCLPVSRCHPSLASPPSTGRTSVVEGESAPPTSRSPSSSTALVCHLLEWRVSW